MDTKNQVGYYRIVGGFNADGVGVNVVVCDNEDFMLEIADDKIAYEVVELLNRDLRVYELRYSN